mmetsp:Transcript_2311/g.5472  ORF Transcript_2311/g.5472 Transcript_2311/m.5472 type:complete len:320 (-) Transcript_2311:441-1400(-)
MGGRVGNPGLRLRAHEDSLPPPSHPAVRRLCSAPRGRWAVQRPGSPTGQWTCPGAQPIPPWTRRRNRSGGLPRPRRCRLFRPMLPTRGLRSRAPSCISAAAVPRGASPQAPAQAGRRLPPPQTSPLGHRPTHGRATSPARSGARGGGRASTRARTPKRAPPRRRAASQRARARPGAAPPRGRCRLASSRTTPASRRSSKARAGPRPGPSRSRAGTPPRAPAAPSARPRTARPGTPEPPRRQHCRGPQRSPPGSTSPVGSGRGGGRRTRSRRAPGGRARSCGSPCGCEAPIRPWPNLGVRGGEPLEAPPLGTATRRTERR